MNKSKYWIFPLCIILLLAVFISGILVGLQIDRFSSKDSSTDIVISDSVDEEEENEDTLTDDDSDEDADAFERKPGIMVEELSIFRAAYDNANGDITVQSLGKDKVVAPGTDNSHRIRVVNTGNCALNYELFIEDLFPDAEKDRIVPIEIRMMDCKGNYVLGSADEWVALGDLQENFASGTVGKNQYVYYDLMWRWPYETEDAGNDAYDTLLGTVATEEVVECGVKISTYASFHPNPDAQSGFDVPQTSDSNQMILWLLVAGLALLAIILFLFARPKKDDKEE